jgi:hypothetical protein
LSGGRVDRNENVIHRVTFVPRDNPNWNEGVCRTLQGVFPK